MRHRTPAGGGLLRRLAGDKSGNFAVMAALTALVALMLTAFAVDEGSLFTERREAQALADLAAIAAAANIDNAETAALTTLTDNGIATPVLRQPGAAPDTAGGKVSVTVVRGRYASGPGAAAGRRFTANAAPFNAVEVSLNKKGTLFFGSAFTSPPVIGVKAVAAATPQAAFSLGSRLASLDGGIVNDLLGALVGGKIALQAMDYDRLLQADIGVLPFLDALATRLNLTAGSYADVLASQATVGQIANAMADVPGLDSASRAALQAVAAGAASKVAIPLSKLVDLGPVGKLALGQQPPGLDVEAGALGMLMAAASLANGTNQAAVNLATGIPGLTNLSLAIAIGEPPQSSPWMAVGEPGATVRTAQTRIKLSANVTVGVPNLGGGIELASVKLPLHVEVAHAQATLADISCPTGRPDSRTVTVSVTPGIASAWLAESKASGFADFSRPQTFTETAIAQVKVSLLLLGLKLLGVNGYAFTTIGNATPTTLVFNDAEIAAGTVKSTPTSNFTQSLIGSLTGNLSISIDLLGLPINLSTLLGAVKPAIVATLNGVAKPVDDLLYNVLGALGVKLGEADVRVTGATCGRSVLVQ